MQVKINPKRSLFSYPALAIASTLLFIEFITLVLFPGLRHTQKDSLSSVLAVMSMGMAFMVGHSIEHDILKRMLRLIRSVLTISCIVAVINSILLYFLNEGNMVVRSSIFALLLLSVFSLSGIVNLLVAQVLRIGVARKILSSSLQYAEGWSQAPEISDEINKRKCRIIVLWCVVAFLLVFPLIMRVLVLFFAREQIWSHWFPCATVSDVQKAWCMHLRNFVNAILY